MRRSLLVLTFLILLTGCPKPVPCPHYPKPSEEVRETLRPYQDKEKYPDTWAWFNALYKLCIQLGDCADDASSP